MNRNTGAETGYFIYSTTINVSTTLKTYLTEKIKPYPNVHFSYSFLQAIYYTLFGKPKKDLNGELALVTGGGNGLGRLLALRLTKLGAKVIVWDINQDGK